MKLHFSLKNKLVTFLLNCYCDITGIIMGVPTFVTVQWVVALPSVLLTGEATRVGCFADITHLYPARCRPTLFIRHYYQTCWLDEIEWSVGWRPVADRE